MAAAADDTIEGCPSYARMLLLPLLCLVLLLLLLLALPRLQRLQCCCRLQECTTPRVTHAPCLPSTVLMLRRALPPSVLQMR